MDHRVQQHRRVAVREHETVAVWPQRIFRVVTQKLLPKGVRGRSQRHRRTWMSGVRLLDAVHGERAYCVDTEQIDLCAGGYSLVTDGHYFPLARPDSCSRLLDEGRADFGTKILSLTVALILHREQDSQVGDPQAVAGSTLIGVFRNGAQMRGWKPGTLRQVDLILADLVLQRGGQLIDVAGGEAHYSGLEYRDSVASDGVAPHLDEQGLHGIRIVFLGSHPDQFLQRNTERQRFTVGTGADHGVEGVSQGDNPDCLRHLFLVHAVGVAGAVSALMVPAHNFRNLRPRKLDVADNLMSHHGVIGHLAEFLRIERRGLAEETLVHRHFADVMQVP